MPSAISKQREQIKVALPALAIRIFALQGKLYDGSGFHWAKVRRIGGLLERVNDFNNDYPEAQLRADMTGFGFLMEDVEKAEKDVALHEMIRTWVSTEVQPHIDAGDRNFRLAPPKDVEIWDHAKEDNFYRELDDILRPLGFHACSTKPVKGEPRHVTLVMAITW